MAVSSDDFLDPYLDPETGLLRNLVDARTKDAIDQAEGDLAFLRLMQLMERPPKPSGDLAELQAIHQHLFQDVYEWAGQIRTVDMRKNVEGAQFFLPVGMIDRAANFAATELRDENMLRALPRDRFVDRITRDAGWQLDWRPVRGSANDQACRAASDRQDFAPLLDMFGQIVTKATPARERDDIWLAAERARLSFRKES